MNPKGLEFEHLSCCSVVLRTRKHSSCIQPVQVRQKAEPHLAFGESDVRSADTSAEVGVGFTGRYLHVNPGHT